MHSATIAVFRSVRPHLTSEQANELLRQKRPTSLAEWDVAIRNIVGTDASQWLPQLVRAGLASWVATQTDAQDVLRILSLRDPRLGVWGACAVAETVLHNIPAGEDRPRIAIETARRWVQGLATREECSRVTSVNAAYVAHAAHAAHAAAYSASTCAAAAYSASIADFTSSSTYATRAAYFTTTATYSASDYKNFTRCLRELCSVVAEAILTFPVG